MKIINCLTSANEDVFKCYKFFDKMESLRYKVSNINEIDTEESMGSLYSCVIINSELDYKKYSYKRIKSVFVNERKRAII